MAAGVCRSIPNRRLTIAFSLLGMCAAPLVVAQRPAGHAVGVSPRISSPAIYHAPASEAPAFHTPVYSSRYSSGFVGSHFIPRRPIRPFPPVVFFYDFPFAYGSPFLGFNCWSVACDLFWPGMFDYNAITSPGPTNYVAQANEAPNFYGSGLDYGLDTDETPQLYLKDGSILNVTDYWLLDDQLHFTIVQDYGAKPVEEVIPFEALDLQKTVDVNTRRGFRFLLRNEPLEQYVRDHPEGPPSALTPR